MNISTTAPPRPTLNRVLLSVLYYYSLISISLKWALEWYYCRSGSNCRYSTDHIDMLLETVTSEEALRTLRHRGTQHRSGHFNMVLFDHTNLCDKRSIGNRTLYNIHSTTFKSLTTTIHIVQV